MSNRRYSEDLKASFFAWLIAHPSSTIAAAARHFEIPAGSARRMVQNYPGPLPQKGRRGRRRPEREAQPEAPGENGPASPGASSRSAPGTRPDAGGWRPREAPPVLEGAQQAALEGLIAGFTHAEAAEYAGVSMVTLAQWLDDPIFTRAMSAAERLLSRQDERAFTSLLPEAIKTHRKILTSERTADSDRLRAVEMVYNRISGYAPVQRVDQRLNGKIETTTTATVVIDLTGLSTEEIRNLAEAGVPESTSGAAAGEPAEKVLQLRPPEADPRWSAPAG